MDSPPVLVIEGQPFVRHLQGVFHLENPKRMAAVETVMNHPSLAGRWQAVAPRPATIEELAWIHTRDYIDQVAQTAGQPFASLDLETQTTADSYETARLAAGGVFCLIDRLRAGKEKRGFAFVRPPGHHAEPDRGMGFCLFNNTALGAAYLKRRHGAARVMIVDVDAHHGNGIQTAFYDTDDVLYVSLHRFPGFPGTGQLGEIGRGKGTGFNVNVPLGKGQGDLDVARVLHHIVLPLAREYRPEAILVACGFDLYQYDRLGGMAVTPNGYALIARLLITMAESVCGGQILFILEGGYSLRGIRECGLRVMQELCGLSAVNGNMLAKVQNTAPSRFSIIPKVMAIHHNWGAFRQTRR